ncbi:maleylpyruvate isomerase family mycothiol-dependent enzyme [Saccharopolyspora sp. HNM0983]|uniref:Maleylpyruvate isomerase family mycothiol-dependent enzyme n=1 Tax=Saccharopolyspora montiporae TaxID=2781240 RepID=A0A929G0B9_9PSEU|nr:maleylpyruvate isomerase family mycothiol-dependent enzyme [Saccharopolyspora sp. HNM0983]MBE9375440.1 maleylpyruvate isomerase family mycothiol-dependent enzyme [Saccharopolyspora sp. HNM0983]
MADTALDSDGHNRLSPATAAQLARQASAGTAAVDEATRDLLDATAAMDQTSVHEPSLLPGWTRAHVLAHLSRDADARVNALTWARTGIEHPMYPSPADRDADIDNGARRDRRVLLDELEAASDRFTAAAQALPSHAWLNEVCDELLRAVPAMDVLRARLLEVRVHTIDLDCGVGFDDIPLTEAEQLLEDTVQEFGGRADVPALIVTADFGDHERSWSLRGTTTAPAHAHGPPGAVLGWLLGRGASEDIAGDAPALPFWL